jgi:putative heme-binding domain-containing protein
MKQKPKPQPKRPLKPRPVALLITVVATIALATSPAWRLVAQDVRNLKPLPRFLRNAVTADRYLSTRDVEDLLGFERVEPVCLQLIKRPGVPRHARVEAIDKLAELRGTDGATELLPWIEYWDQQPTVAPATARGARSDDPQRQQVAADLASLLPEQPRAALEPQRERLVKLANEGHTAATRQGALAAMIQADASADGAWQLAAQRTGGLEELLRGIAWLPAEAPREQLFERVQPLLAESSDAELRRAAIEAIGMLDVAPRQVFEQLTELVAQDVHPDACVASICRISSDHWTEARRRPLADALIRHLAATPLAERTTPLAQQTVKLVRKLAELMPSDQAAPLLRDLQLTTVRQIHVRTLVEQMAYDQTVLVVQAGQAIQIVFENDDIMPHNLVIVESPEAREIVGIAADRMQNEPDALARGYLPDSPHILHATRMLEPRQTDRLTFVAPQQAGTYAYLCTFPGHWIKMYGALVVSDDAAAFLASNDPLPSADKLLRIETVAWTYEQLAAELPRLASGRSFENGERCFLKASCYACHQVQQQGGRIGPDLTLIRDKYKTPEELLRHILLPSEKVEEQYATVIVETAEGQIIRGVLVGEDESQVQINENPLATCEPRVIKKDQIEDLTRSQLSPMPEQLLNTLTRADDVLDLLAYLIAGGDRQAPMFQ